MAKTGLGGILCALFVMGSICACLDFLKIVYTHFGWGENEGVTINGIMLLYVAFLSMHRVMSAVLFCLLITVCRLAVDGR